MLLKMKNLEEIGENWKLDSEMFDEIQLLLGGMT